MKKLDIKLNILGNGPHETGIIAGFILLKRQGIINLKINKLNKDCINKYPHTCLVEAIINDKIKVAYDLLDGYNLNLKELDKYLDGIDYYFKRSFSAQKNSLLANKEKIYPLGFNYSVNLKGDLNDNLYNNIKNILRKIIKNKKSKFYINDFELVPSYDVSCNPKVIFCTRLWNPDGEADEVNNGIVIDSKLKEEREYINNLRVDIIKQLKLMLKENFIGGIYNSLYARENYPDLILDNNITDKENYLKIMQSADICIGSMGLHESIGWKTAEYIASSKAIVNERFRYEVIGEFNELENYLAFETSEECINHIKYLINNPKDIMKMQMNNFIYYNKYLRPDKQVLNSLLRVLEVNNK